MVNAIQFCQSYSNGPDEIFDINDKIECPTGYCKFGKAQTLAVGRRCVVREDIKSVLETEEYAAYQTLPGTDMKFYPQGYRGATEQRILAKSYTEWPNEDEEYETDLFGRKMGWLIVRTAMLFTPITQVGNTISQDTQGVECALFWYVKTSEIDVNQTSNFRPVESVNNMLYDLELSEDGARIKPETCFVDGEKVPVSNDTYYEENCLYHVGNRAQGGLQNLLVDADYGLKADLTVLDRERISNSSSEPTPHHDLLSIFTINMYKASSNRTNEEAFDYINMMWSNMAFAATQTVRRASTAGANSQRSKLNTGMVFAPVVYYEINWIRLAMPAFMVLSCACFVCHVALLTKNEYAWRRSALPLLFHGLENDERAAQGDVRDFSVMRHVAKAITVRLEEHVDATGAKFTTRHVGNSELRHMT